MILDKNNCIGQYNYNTNNAWGFGGGIGTEYKYPNGISKRVGTAYYRHAEPERYTKWFVDITEDFRVEIQGKRKHNSSVYIYECNESFRAFWGEHKVTDYGWNWSIYKIIK